VGFKTCREEKAEDFVAVDRVRSERVRMRVRGNPYAYS
jgi:hypothetical protein